MCSSEDLDALEGVANGKLSNGSCLGLKTSFCHWRFPYIASWFFYDLSMVRIVQK